MTRTKSTYLALVAVLLSPMAANADLIGYDVTYDANVGPDGTGTFIFDTVLGAITDFVWDFGSGTVGGISGAILGTTDVFGDTRGRFVFEILSETDVHSGVDCINVGCSAGQGLYGLAPFGATYFRIIGSPSVGFSDYVFWDDAQTQTTLASGYMSISTASVPEPGTLALFGIGLLGMAASRRRKKA